MSIVIELSVDQSPPNGPDWAMVVVNKAGAAMGEATIRHSMGATFYTKRTDAEINRAIAKAMTWADAHGVESVYVRR